MSQRKAKIAKILSDKKIVGLVEPVKIIGKKRAIETLALLDTGATRSSVDLKIAARAGLGPITSVARIKSKAEPKGYTRRAIVAGQIEIAGVRRKVHFTLADRLGMRYPVLVGRDVLHEGFVVDIEKTHNGFKLTDIKEDVEQNARDKNKRSKA
ncbi:MAG: ATP-dependent zinc protease [Candidatus Diapherotrites archaeon]|nr:ATP-dependent zinc protease [Candidatus Diapherotrites archaeon]